MIGILHVEMLLKIIERVHVAMALLSYLDYNITLQYLSGLDKAMF